jgi:hypothetical protein
VSGSDGIGIDSDSDTHSDPDGDLSRGMFRFIDSMKRGLTFLTIETHGPDINQYLYAPAIGRPRRIASQDRQNNFEDTDLTYEDLGGLKLDDYTYTGCGPRRR